jgi:hypothetical protein
MSVWVTGRRLERWYDDRPVPRELWTCCTAQIGSPTPFPVRSPAKDARSARLSYEPTCLTELGKADISPSGSCEWAHLAAFAKSHPKLLSAARISKPGVMKRLPAAVATRNQKGNNYRRLE